MKKKLDTRSNDLKDFDDISDTIDEFYDSDKLNSDILFLNFLGNNFH